MDKDQKITIQNTINFVKKTLKNAEGGHDWFHIERVYNTTLHISKSENVNSFITALGALLHDIADAKFYEGDETLGPKMAREFLKKQRVSDEIINEIEYIINNISFKNTINKKGSKPKTMELQVSKMPTV